MQPPYGYGPPPPVYGYPPPRPSRGGPLAILLAIVGVLLVFGIAIGVVVSVSRGRAKKAEVASSTVWSDLDSPVPVSSDDPMRGDRFAAVTIVVFSDFQCPFCKKYETTLDDVRARYGKDVRIIWKNEPLPFHSNARPAAEAARGVFMLGGNDAFWQFHDKAFANQSTLDEAHYESWATLAGVDSKAIARGMTAHTWGTKIDDDDLLAKSLKATGTPTSFINGILVTGAQPLTTLQTTIDGELPKARARLASGTAPDRLYVELSKSNFSAPPVVATAATVAPPTGPETIYKVPIGTSPVRGPSTALVTIVEFSDFQCPFCGRAQTTLDKIRSDYPKEVRFVWKNKPLPFHNRALPAAELAIEGRTEKGDTTFWSLHDELFATQTHLEDADLLSIARRFGVDEGKVSTAILTKKYQSEIDTDDKLGTSVGVSGTPTFFINGRQLVGAQAYPAFKDIIDEEITSAKAELAKGTAQASLYDTMTSRGSIPRAGSGPVAAGGASVTIVDTLVGTGATAKNGDKLTVHYTGTLAGGTKFDSSRDTGKPFEFTLGSGMVIKGWDQGLVGMRVGGRRTITIPPELGYGSRGAPPKIPPDATLTFDIELISLR